jgi:multiple sugar transport system ATP-binding protein
MATVTFADATRTYPGSTEPAVDRLNLEIGDGEFLVLVGPSGCGKSTLLRMIAGLEEISRGEIAIGDRVVNNVPPKDRDIAMVFQNYALYPHMTVAENMAFALKISRVSKDEIQRRVSEASKLLDLDQYLERKPKALSGGQRQRVAMGRAIVREPQVFLMDEPLSNLDAKLRVSTRTQIASLQRRLGVTTLYVTHDQVEAMTMGDRVAVMNLGVLQQADTPMHLYNKPANAFVAGFIGSPAMNLFLWDVADGTARLGDAHIELPRTIADQVRAEQQIILGFRPETVEVVSADDPAASPLWVNVVEELGADAFVYGTFGKQHVVGELLDDSITVRIDPTLGVKAGDSLPIRVPVEKLHFFHPQTQLRLEP